MFKEQLLIALFADTQTSADENENGHQQLMVKTSTINALQADHRFDVVVVASDDDRVLAAAHAADAVNHRVDAVSGDEEPLTAALRQLLNSDDQLIDEDAWVVCVGSNHDARRLTQVIDLAIGKIEASDNAKAVSAIAAETGSPVLHLVQVAAFVEATGLPQGTVTFLS